MTVTTIEIRSLLRSGRRGLERTAVVDEGGLLAARCRSGIDFLDHLVRIGARPEDHRMDREVLVRCLERRR